MLSFSFYFECVCISNDILRCSGTIRPQILSGLGHKYPWYRGGPIAEDTRTKPRLFSKISLARIEHWNEESGLCLVWSWLANCPKSLEQKAPFFKNIFGITGTIRSCLVWDVSILGMAWVSANGTQPSIPAASEMFYYILPIHSGIYSQILRQNSGDIIFESIRKSKFEFKSVFTEQWVIGRSVKFQDKRIQGGTWKETSSFASKWQKVSMNH